MRRGYYLSLFAVLAGGVVHADEPSKGHYDLSAEIEWARKRWPDDFKGLHFYSPLAKLLAWVPPGRTVPAFLFTNREFSDTHACRRVELSRGVTESGELLPSLEAKINDRATIEERSKTRTFTILRVGRWLVQPEYGATYSESLDARGRWQPESSGSGFNRVIYGALSYVDDRVARFDGEPQEMHAYCGGPEEWLSCPTGGERPCERCEMVGMMFTEVDAGWGHGRGDDGRAITCHDRCPRYPETPDLKRLGELDAHVNLWRPRKDSLAVVPSLYKSRDDCLREHYHGGDGATGARN